MNQICISEALTAFALRLHRLVDSSTNGPIVAPTPSPQFKLRAQFAVLQLQQLVVARHRVGILYVSLGVRGQQSKGIQQGGPQVKGHRPH